MKKLFSTVLFLISSFLSFSQSTIVPDSNFEQALVDLNIDSDGLNGSILNSDANQITVLNVANKNINDLTGIEVFYNLKELKVQGNQLSSINLVNQPDLLWLNCSNNNLSNLDVSNNLGLIHLICSENLLSGTFDLSNHHELLNLQVELNQITNIIFEYGSGIIQINCSSNNINNLDLSSFSNLKSLFAQNNNLISLNIANSANSEISNFNAIGNPNLTCINVDNPLYSTYAFNWTKDELANYSDNCFWLSIDENNFDSFTIYPNPVKQVLNINLNNINADFGELFSVNGSLIKKFYITNSNISLNLSNIDSGIYIIKIADVQSKFIKN